MRKWYYQGTAAFLLTGMVMLSGCGNQSSESSVPTGTVPTETVQLQTETPTEETVFETQPVLTEAPTLPEKMFEVETPYCSFDFPEKWKDEVRIEHTEEKPYTVEFFAALPDGKEQHIFDLAFDVQKEEAIGTIQTEDGMGDLYISLTPYTFDHMEELSDEEMEHMMQLQDYSLDILQILTRDYGFTFLG